MALNRSVFLIGVPALTAAPCLGVVIVVPLEHDAYGTVTDVHLEVTGTVAADRTTWGQIKATYR